MGCWSVESSENGEKICVLLDSDIFNWWKVYVYLYNKSCTRFIKVYCKRNDSKCFFLINCLLRFRTWYGLNMVIKDPLLDYGTPEEEAWRWKFIPLYIRFQRRRDSYLYTVKYYDKPEGQDLVGKLIATNRILIPFGLTWGLMDAFFHGGRNMPGFQQKFGRVVHFTWPAAGVATAFTSTVYFATKFRNGKDDL